MKLEELKLTDFDFELPEELIAKYPCDKRDQSRMLVYENSQIKHQDFKSIIDYFEPGEILVRNNTKVLPARLFIENKQGTQIELLLIKEVSPYLWQAMAKPAKRLKEERLEYKLRDSDLTIEAYKKDNQVYVDFKSHEHFEKVISNNGQMPIPPYFKREAQDLDKERYQTVYADSNPASVAAPTAGLHFTDEIFTALKNKGVEVIDLTLHVGIGTFAPVKVENIKEHEMHSEYFEIDETAWQKVLAAKEAGNKITAIGSTSVRTLESVARTNNLLGETDIFIYPGFEFKIVDRMLTNFHLPKSSLIMMISAFVGLDNVKAIYNSAIQNNYRFYSYGDCCLLEK